MIMHEAKTSILKKIYSPRWIIARPTCPLISIPRNYHYSRMQTD